MRFPFAHSMRLIAIAALLLLASPVVAQESVISAVDANAMLTEGKLLLIDLRTPEEWRQTGVPAEARRINVHDPEGPAAFLEKVLGAAGGDKSRPIGLICRVGNRSTQAQKLLLAKGFTNVVNIKEGVMGNDSGPGWIKRGLPTDACPSC
ncbi:rhodanese-like domain-containing protein [Paramagnetospirillum magnetotacticum]|nr:rhodanese-like domain-containing protein [Paramagnetospirillum magnetotacticum]